MSTVQEIEAAIAKLKPAEIQQVAAWITSHKSQIVSPDRLGLRRQARGMWKDRTDLPDLGEMRRESDRF